MRRRGIKQPKRPVYLGCEGESEIVNDILRAADLPFHLQVEVLAPGAGDPLARVQRAMKRIAELERRRDKFHLKAILMDFDQVSGALQRSAEAKRLAESHGVSLIWQDPCHEALLLRHLPNCSNRRPPNCRVAERTLKQFWPEYVKPMARAQLANRINLNAIQQASDVEPLLRAFLRNIGLIP